MSLLIDTLPLLELIRPADDTEVIAGIIREAFKNNQPVFISAISHAEALSHIATLNSVDMNNGRQNLNTILSRFGRNCVLPFGGRAIESWSELRLRYTPDMAVNVEELIVAATAKANNFLLITKQASWHSSATDIRFQYI